MAEESALPSERELTLAAKQGAHVAGVAAKLVKGEAALADAA